MENPGNLFGPFAMAMWIVVTFVLFQRNKPAKAGAISVLGGILFLPESVQVMLPIFPDVNKFVLTIVATTIAAFVLARRKFVGVKMFEGVDAVFLVLLIGNIGTWLTNTDVLVYGAGKTVLIAHGLYDAISGMVSDLVVVYGMYYIGRVLFSSLEDVIELFRVMFVCGLIYVVCAMIELRLSPQMHTWVYGFMQSDFVHAARGDGYRPLVFLTNGLLFARFLAVALIAGIVLWRLNLLSKKTVYALLFSIGIFSICKSLGALLMFIAFAPVVAFGQLSTQRKMAFVLTFIVATYPVARGFDWVPVDEMLEMAADYNPQRGESLQVRFNNEAAMLDKVRERPWFGWGGYNRGLIYNSVGENTSVIDGEWIGVMDSRGIFGFVGCYGLYLLPIFVAVRRLKLIQSTEHALVLGVLAMIATFLALDTIPNAANSLPHHFFSGAVMGAANGFVREDQRIRRARLQARRERLAARTDPAAA